MRKKSPFFHTIALHIIGLLMMIGFIGSGSSGYSDFMSRLFYRVYVYTYVPTSRQPARKTSGSFLNTAAPADTSTSKDPGSNPPPPPPIP